MQDDFKLIPTGPDADSIAQAEQLIAKLKQLAASKRARRPLLTAWSLRLEPSLHRDLKRLADRLEPDLSMTDVVHGLLEIMVPLLLKGRGVGPMPVDLTTMSDETRQQLTGLLGSLTELVQRSGTKP